MSTMAFQITRLTIVYSTVYSGADQRKHQRSVSLAFVRGIHRWPVNLPHKGPLTRKMFPFDDAIIFHKKDWLVMRNENYLSSFLIKSISVADLLKVRITNLNLVKIQLLFIFLTAIVGEKRELWAHVCTRQQVHESGGLRRHRSHYDVIVMCLPDFFYH